MKALVVSITRLICGGFFIIPLVSFCQDSTITLERKIITLKEVVVRNNLNVAGFIYRIENDTTFYKAFKNLRILQYNALNDIRMLNKKGIQKASLQSKTKQVTDNGCRSMQVMEEAIAGDIYDNKGNWNYYTAELYANLFLQREGYAGRIILLKAMQSVQRGKVVLKNIKNN